MQNIHCFSVLTLSPTNAPLALRPTSDSPDSNSLPVLDVLEEVFVIIRLCLVQVVPVTGFGLPCSSFCISIVRIHTPLLV